MPLVAAAELQTFSLRVLMALGLPADDAATVAHGLMYASLRGVDSHGVMRLIQYSECLKRGEINPVAQVAVVYRRRTSALIDADGGYGFVPTLMAMDLAVELAAANDLGLVGVRNSHHFGMAATYAERAADAGYIGIVATNTGPVMAPIGGRRASVGNNPIAFAIPRRSPAPPLILDMALSATAFGRIRLAAAEGRPIPLGWAFDSGGQPTTDALIALKAGLLAPMGAHKGYGLAVVIDILTGLLTGSLFGSRADAHSHVKGGVGHVVVALAPDIFIDREVYLRRIEELVMEIKSVPLAEGYREIFLPGEIELETRRRREAEGVPISNELARQLAILANDLDVEPIPGPT